jgi:hypothetical protein
VLAPRRCIRHRLSSLAGLAAALACSGAPPRAPPASEPALGAGDVAGTVVDARGAPVADAVVALVRGAQERPEAVTRTDGQGRFRFYERAPGAFALTATSPEGTAAFLPRQRLEAGASLEGRRLALGAGGFTVRGGVVDRAGRPFPLARVLALRLGADQGDLFVAFADARGRYELVLTAAPHLLIADGDGHASREPARAVPDGPAALDLVLEPRTR